MQDIALQTQGIGGAFIHDVLLVMVFMVNAVSMGVQGPDTGIEISDELKFPAVGLTDRNGLLGLSTTAGTAHDQIKF